MVKKTILQENGSEREITEQELQEYFSNPKYMLQLVEEDDGKTVYKLLEQLLG